MTDNGQYEARRKVRIALKGPGTEQGASVNAFCRVLHAHQNLVYQIGMYLMPGLQLSRTGSYPDLVVERCELLITKTEPGSLTADISLRDIQQPLLKTGTWGHDALDLGTRVLEKAQQGIAEEEIAELVDDPVARLRVLTTSADCCPREDEKFWVEYQAPTLTQPIKLQAATGKSIRDFVKKQSTREMAVAGPVIGVRLTGKKHIEVATAHGPIRCYLDPERAAEAAHYIERVLSVTGVAKVDAAGQVRSIQQITQVEELDAAPFEPQYIQHGNVLFRLTRPLRCGFRFEGARWLLDCSELAIHVAGASRDSAVQELSEEFAFIWEEYGQADDAHLTLDAHDLKRKVRGIVAEVTEV